MIDKDITIPPSEQSDAMRRMRIELGETSLSNSTGREDDGEMPMLGERGSDDSEFSQLLQETAEKYLPSKPAVIYHPASGEHVTAATAFPDSRVIFSDSDGEVQHRFSQHNLDVTGGKKDGRTYEFYRGDMHTLDLPDGIKADIVICMNAPSLTKDELDKLLAVGGIVIESDTRESDEWGGENATSAIAKFDGYELLMTKHLDVGLETFFIYRRKI